jgi:DNA-repair protein XRCC1
LKRKEAEAEKRKKMKRPNEASDVAKLPRRDRMPGESPPRKREKKSDSPPPSTSRENSAKKEKKKKPSVARRPFGKLLEGVVFTISGYQNPQRGHIRQKATEMGAK